MQCAVALAAAIALSGAARGPAQDSAGGDPALARDPAPAPSQAEREIKALTARIAGLEKAISAARASPRAPSSLPPDPASPPPGSPAPVSTASARDAGTRAAAGAGDAAQVKVLRDLFQRRDAPGLTKELGSLLARGAEAHATLYDFLNELDRDSRKALLLSYDYHFSFSLVHLAILHQDELAKLAHYFLAASEKSPRSTLRRTLFDFLPVLLRYYPGRYPDLERDLQEEILLKLTDGKGDLQMYYGCMESLGYRPPLEVFEPLLERASSHAETLPVVLHLQARNDPAAVGILSRNIARNPPGNDWKSSLMLDALVRMSAPEAASTLLGFLKDPDDSLRAAAVEAYFSVPRDETSLPLLKDFLNASGDLEKKRVVIRRLRRLQPALLEALKTGYENLRPEVWEVLANEGLKPPK